MEGPCGGELSHLHVKNPLHYKGKPLCSRPPAHSNKLYWEEKEEEQQELEEEEEQEEEEQEEQEEQEEGGKGGGGEGEEENK